MLKPWIRFVEPVQSARILQLVSSHVERLEGCSEDTKSAISSLVRATKDPKAALAHLTDLAPYGTVQAFIDVLSGKTIGSLSESVKVERAGLVKLLELAEKEPLAYDLIAKLVEVSPSAARAFARLLATEETINTRRELLPAIQLLLDLPGALPSSAHTETLVQTAIETLISKSSPPKIVEAACNTVVSLATAEGPSITAVRSITWQGFNPHLAKLISLIVTHDSPKTASLVKFLMEVGLQWAVRALSSDGELHEATFSSMAYLRML
jgi:hypothetical protein